MFYLESVRKMLADALALEDISIPPKFVFIIHGYMKSAGPGWRGTHDSRYRIYSIAIKNVLKKAIAIDFGRSICCQLALSQKVTASGSGHSCSSDFDNESSDVDDMKIGNGSDSSCNLQLRGFYLTDSPQMRKYYIDCGFHF